MTEAIQLYDRITDPVTAIQTLGTSFAKSGMFGCDKIEQGVVLAAICFAERKSPTQILRSYDIVDGKLRKKSLAALADFREQGGRHKWLATGDDGIMAEIELTLEGNTIKSRFTIEDAKRQGLVRDKSNWIKSPGNMLRARAVSNGVAMLAPEIFAGDTHDDEQSVPAPKPLLPAVTQRIEVQTGKPAESQAIEVSASRVEEKPVAPAPIPTPEPAARPSIKIPEVVAALNSKGHLTTETLIALHCAITDAHAARALEWLIAKGKLEAGKNLENISPAIAQRILDNPPAFLKAIGAA